MALPLLKDDSFSLTSNTDWAALSEQRAIYGLSEPDNTGPAQLLALANSLGLPCLERDGLVLTTIQPEPRTVTALVSATELFYGMSADLDVACEQFYMKLAMYQDSYRALSGVNACLYIVDLSGWLSKQEHVDLARMVEADGRGVRKVVCPAGELASLLENPFGPSYQGVKVPQFEVQRTSVLQTVSAIQRAAPTFKDTVTHPFGELRYPYDYVTKLLKHKDAMSLVKLANTLVRRVMGSEFKFEVGSREVMFSQYGEWSEMPWFCLSSGQQQGLAFCAYMATIADKVTQDSWLGITDALTRMDLLHFLKALDVVGDFMQATGSSVFLQADNSDYREFAISKFQMAVACLKARNS